MPYLHWETDRGRMRSADTIKEASKVKLSSMAEVVDRATVVKDQSTYPDRHSRTRNDFNQPQLSARPLIAAPRTQRMRILGKMLLSAAALLEAMDFRLDEKLIYEYLHQRPPLHPRRTLDQSYYGALKNTGTRDRDQVVYRATTPEPHDCLERMDKKDGKCKQCHEDIRKVPRLVMVDQLWMWILDESTSYFPTFNSKLRPWTCWEQINQLKLLLQKRSLPASRDDGPRTNLIHQLCIRAYACVLSPLMEMKSGLRLISRSSLLMSALASSSTGQKLRIGSQISWISLPRPLAVW